MVKRGAKKPVKKEVVAPSPAPKPERAPDNSVKEIAAIQREATMALTEVAAQALDNPQLTQLITMLSQPQPEAPYKPKRLTVQRDGNGLISSIDIKEI